MQPDEFSSSISSDWSSNDDSVGGSYLPSAFVGQPVGIEQVVDVWRGDSGATSHMARNADLMYDTRPPPPHRSRFILGDGWIKKVQFIGKIDLVFHSRTDSPVILYDASSGPDLGFNLFSFHIVQGKHEMVLNKKWRTYWVVVYYSPVGVTSRHCVLLDYYQEEPRTRVPYWQLL